MTALFVSPHLDDAVFSAGGTIARLVAAGVPVTVATVFTRSVVAPTGFALACQTDKGIPAEVDYMALRRAEDAEACTRLGARCLWLDLPEAPHRGYEDAAALFGPRRADDALEPVTAVIAPLLGDAVFVAVPMAMGDHVDHHLVADAVRALRPDGPTAAWEDMPYALRVPGRTHGSCAVLGLSGADIDDKLDACAAYRSQLGFQFGGEAGMREALRRAFGCCPGGERFAPVMSVTDLAVLVGDRARGDVPVEPSTAFSGVRQ